MLKFVYRSVIADEPLPRVAAMRDDLQIRSLFDDPTIRRLIGLPDGVPATAPASADRIRKSRRLDRRRLLGERAA